MSVTKTEVVSVRVSPDIKVALVAAATAERRSIASMVEMMVLAYCDSHGDADAARRPPLKGPTVVRKGRVSMNSRARAATTK